MKDQENSHPEPYEVMPEGSATQFVDRITKAVTLAMLILIGLMIYLLASPASAEEGRNWCADWQEGYEYSFYMKCRSCQTIEPKHCPYPEYPGQDGKLKGIKDGAADGKAKQKEKQS